MPLIFAALMMCCAMPCSVFLQLTNFSSGHRVASGGGRNEPDESQVAGFNQDLFEFFQDTMQSDWMAGTRRWMGEHMQVRVGVGMMDFKGGGKRGKGVGGGGHGSILSAPPRAVSKITSTFIFYLGSLHLMGFLAHQEDDTYHDLCQRMCLCKGGPCIFGGDGNEQVKCY